jgi:hypothetical protein
MFVCCKNDSSVINSIYSGQQCISYSLITLSPGVGRKLFLQEVVVGEELGVLRNPQLECVILGPVLQKADPTESGYDEAAQDGLPRVSRNQSAIPGKIIE